MTLLEAIDLVIARTGVERYRHLCLHHPSPTVRAEYSGLIFRLAAEGATGLASATTPSAAEFLALLSAVRSCPYRSLEAVPTGCGCGRCGLRGGIRISHLDCLTCVRRYG
jgi:hypothetical protein